MTDHGASFRHDLKPVKGLGKTKAITFGNNRSGHMKCPLVICISLAPTK